MIKIVKITISPKTFHNRSSIVKIIVGPTPTDFVKELVAHCENQKACRDQSRVVGMSSCTQ